MRIWYGAEQEGREAGLKTLFIESPTLTDAGYIFSKIEKTDISRLYFGAGKVEILALSDDFFGFFKSRGYKVVVEMSVNNNLIGKVLRSEIDEIILRLDTPEEVGPAKVSFKTDNGQVVDLYYPDDYSTLLTCVREGLYDLIDTILWEE